MTFMELLRAKWDEGKFVCVGLDPAYGKIPEMFKPALEPSLEEKASVIEEFAKAIADATHDVVCAFKPNRAFYARFGWAGIRAVENVCAHIAQTYPDVPLIYDAKFGDIGNTNDGYVDETFGINGANAVTVHPYMGKTSLKPFLDEFGKGIFVLCRTSNDDANEFQHRGLWPTREEINSIGLHPRDYRDTIPDPLPLYQLVAYNVATKWNTNGNCALVVGATATRELAAVRKIVGDMPILIPGVGAQGGKVEDVVPVGIDSNGQGIIINLSRSVLQASGGDDFAEAAVAEVISVNDDILRRIAKTRG